MAFGVGRHGAVFLITCGTFTVQFVTYCSTQQFLEVIHYLNGVAGDTLQKILHSGVTIVTHVLFPEVSIDDLVKSCGIITGTFM